MVAATPLPLPSLPAVINPRETNRSATKSSVRAYPLPEVSTMLSTKYGPFITLLQPTPFVFINLRTLLRNRGVGVA
jgi:hypothetical protein